MIKIAQNVDKFAEHCKQMIKMAQDFLDHYKDMIKIAQDKDVERPSRCQQPPTQPSSTEPAPCRGN